MRIITTITLSLTLFACASSVALTPAGQTVTTRDTFPDSCQELGPVEAIDGRGCGLYGPRGTYQGAYTKLRNAAGAMGANYVRMVSQTEPHQRSKSCFANEFILRGVAFNCPE